MTSAEYHEWFESFAAHFPRVAERLAALPAASRARTAQAMADLIGTLGYADACQAIFEVAASGDVPTAWDDIHRAVHRQAKSLAVSRSRRAFRRSAEPPALVEARERWRQLDPGARALRLDEVRAELAAQDAGRSVLRAADDAAHPAHRLAHDAIEARAIERLAGCNAAGQPVAGAPAQDPELWKGR
jgi:hypothetical protein